MSDLNDLKLQGRIVRDAVLRTTKSGKMIALFTLAVNQTKKNGDSYTETANYFPISTFVKSEKFAAYLKKGQPLILEGYVKQVTKEIGSDSEGNRQFDSRTYICTSNIHLIWTGKKNETKVSDIPEENNEDYIIEAENSQEDVFIGDEQELF
ncbi:single-stranded DNA-binding protein [Treponema sp.]|uniref:single-stranded DNA-binding protein n=1 Tax=Treponema sp. TaxID=166 RepID=UPI003FD72D9A